jgi:hypothetical protein
LIGFRLGCEWLGFERFRLHDGVRIAWIAVERPAVEQAPW